MSATSTPNGHLSSAADAEAMTVRGVGKEVWGIPRPHRRQTSAVCRLKGRETFFGASVNDRRRDCSRPNSITLSSWRAGSRSDMRPASELDSVMEFGLSGAIQLASTSLAGRRPAGRLVADKLRTGLRPGSSYLDMSR